MKSTLLPSFLKGVTMLIFVIYHIAKIVYGDVTNICSEIPPKRKAGYAAALLLKLLDLFCKNPLTNSGFYDILCVANTFQLSSCGLKQKTPAFL